MPVKVDGKYETKTFSKKEDIFEVIDLLIKETKEINAKGKEFDLALSVKSQLPFFCCINKVLDSEMQKDIKRYIYCQTFKVPPFEGGYGNQPADWVDKSFIIKNAFAKLEKEQIEWHNRKLDKQ